MRAVRKPNFSCFITLQYMNKSKNNYIKPQNWYAAIDNLYIKVYNSYVHDQRAHPAKMAAAATGTKFTEV